MKGLTDNPCNGCVAPRRYPGCHAKCPDYIIAAAFHEAERRIEFEKREIESYSVENRLNNTDQARKRRREFKGYRWRHS